MNDTTLLHRQIHPSWVQNNIVSTQAFLAEKAIASLAFIPSEKDKKQLSVYNGEKFTAEESSKHYAFESCGVLSVEKTECTSIEPLNVVEDNEPFDGHTYIDFTKIDSKNQIKKKATRLRNFAVKRNWTYKKNNNS